MICRIWKVSDYTDKPYSTAQQMNAAYHGLETIPIRPIWVVEISTLEDLHAIIAETKSQNGVIYDLTSEYAIDGKRLGEVIIYDDYIE